MKELVQMQLDAEADQLWTQIPNNGSSATTTISNIS